MSICEDYKGFIWIGTEYGLNRFDGETFKLYQSFPSDSTSISDDRIEIVYEDANNNLWIGTENGLNKYNTEFDNFTRYTHRKNDSLSMSDYVYCINEDHKGNLWLGTAGGLEIFDEFTGIFTKVDLGHGESGQKINTVYDIVQQNNSDHLWIGSDDGLAILNIENQEVIRLVDDNGDTYPEIRELCFDSLGNLWATNVWQKGLYHILIDGNDYKVFPFIIEDGTSLTAERNRVRTLNIGPKGNLWLGTENGGLGIINPSTYDYKFILSGEGVESGLPGNSLYSIFTDSRGRTWTGFFKNGLGYIDPQNKKFNHFLGSVGTQITGKAVVSSFEISDSILWVGTDGAGLIKLDHNHRVLRQFLKGQKEGGLKSNAVLDIENDHDGLLWIATYGGGLISYDSKNDHFQSYDDNKINPDKLDLSKIFSIHIDKQNNIWLGAINKNVVGYFDRGKNIIKAVPFDFPERHYEELNIVLKIKDDSKGNIWLSAMASGVFRATQIENGDYEFHPIAYSLRDKIKQGRIVVNCIFEDSKSNIWFGTDENGIVLFEENQDSLLSFDTRHGLAGNSVREIQEDNHGNLWIGTNHGLSKFLPQTKQFYKYDRDDGLGHDEFFRSAGISAKDGKMYFGGVNGFNTFYPSQIDSNPIRPQVYLTKLKIFNQEIEVGKLYSPLQKALSELDELVLSDEHSVFSIEYQALSFTQPQKTQYAYKLEGLETEWNYVGHSKSATYTNLDPGNYTFKVKAANNDGLWNEEGASLDLIILPPWYWTWWAKLVWVSLILGTTFTAYKLRTHSLKEQRRKLQILVNEKTRDLEQSKEDLERSYHQLQELDQYKESMTGMIVHDFKNSLNTVISFSDGKPTARRLKSIRQAGQFMLNMVMNILDVQKFEEAFVKLSLANYKLLHVINEAVDQLNYMLEQKSIDLQIEGDLKVVCRVDSELMVRTLVNILSNAIKYVSMNGQIVINIQEADGIAKISVQDNGVGISKDMLDKVFDKYAQVDAKKSGVVRSTGLGLTFCKMVVEAQGGSIGVQSKQGDGSKFYFTVPLAKEAQLTNVVDKSPKLMSDKGECKLDLSTVQKERLEPFLVELRQWEVYDYSEVIEVVDKIESSDVQISNWKDELVVAVHNVNEERFNELIQIKT